jgi:hypothetical protein
MIGPDSAGPCVHRVVVDQLTGIDVRETPESVLAVTLGVSRGPCRQFASLRGKAQLCRCLTLMTVRRGGLDHV